MITNQILDAIDMSYANPTPTFSALAGIDHYRLLHWIGHQFNNSVFLDVGVRSGASAIAMGHNPTNTVYAFDIAQTGPQPWPNVTYHIGNVLDHADLISQAKVISLDTEHDGVFEREFLAKLPGLFHGVL